MHSNTITDTYIVFLIHYELIHVYYDLSPFTSERSEHSININAIMEANKNEHDHRENIVMFKNLWSEHTEG